MLRLHPIPASVVGMGSGLVEATLTDVPNPLDDIVVTVIEFRLKHLQGGGRVYNRELEGEGTHAGISMAWPGALLLVT